MSMQRSRIQWSSQGEPSLDELLSDPICRLLMRSDGLSHHAVKTFLSQARAPAPMGFYRSEGGNMDPSKMTLT